ncbi:hypothetical protein ACS0TY_021869 [Phlomoides rotata]
MDGNSGTPRGSRGRKRDGSTSRRVWTFVEECELMNALKDLIVKENKCDNGFRSDYLLPLENSLYVCLKNMLEISGVGLNSTTYHVDALPEVWESQIKIFGNDRATGQHSQLYADAVNETMHSAVNQNHSFMDLDEEDESSPATEKNASKCPSFSVDGTSSVAQNKKKGVKRNQSGGAKM